MRTAECWTAAALVCAVLAAAQEATEYDPAFDFSITIEEPTALGLQLVKSLTEGDGLMVREMAKGSVIERTKKVEEGDLLLSVNGRVLQSGKFANAISMLKSPQWPKTLRFRPKRPWQRTDSSEGSGAGTKQQAQKQQQKQQKQSAQAKQEEAAGKATVRVRRPGTLAFTIPAMQALFGATPTCQTAPIVLLSDMGCLRLPAGALQGKIALVDRGRCTFIDKARNVMNAGAIALLLINTNNDLFRLPFGNFDVSDVTLPVLLLPRRQGWTLRQVAPHVEVEVVVGRGDGCPDADAPSAMAAAAAAALEVEVDARGQARASKPTAGKSGAAAAAAVRKPAADQGVRTLSVLSAEGEQTHRAVQALFGGEFAAEPAVLVDVGLACGTVESSPRDAIAITSRGLCPFEEKARALQQLGALGVLVVNSDRSTFRVAAQQGDDITVPVAMLAKEAGEAVLAAIRSARHAAAAAAMPAIGRVSK